MMSDIQTVLEKGCQNWGCFRKQVATLYILLPEQHQRRSQPRHTGNSWPQGFTLAEWKYCPEQPAHYEIYTLMSTKIHREKFQTFPSPHTQDDMLFQTFCWATAHPQIFLLGSLPSTSLVHQLLQGIYKAVHAALPSVHWWHPALYLLPSWPRHSCCQPQTMSGRNWFLE